MTVKEINEEIVRLRRELVDKVGKLVNERDKLLDQQDPPFLNPYVKYTDSDGKVCLFKVIEPYRDYDTGNIFAYKGKVMTVEGAPFYHDDYYLNLSNIRDWKFISEVEFEELLSKGLELIRKDII